MHWTQKRGHCLCSIDLPSRQVHRHVWPCRSRKRRVVSQFEDLQACYLKLRKQGHHSGAEANGSMDGLHSGMSYHCSTVSLMEQHCKNHGAASAEKRLLIAH